MNDPVETYDLPAIKCPLPVLKTRARIRTMETGESLWVKTTDPMAVIDVPHFCNENGHVLSETIKNEDYHLFLIVKGG